MEKMEGDDLGTKGPQCRIISGLHTFRVSVHYVRERFSRCRLAPKEYSSLPKRDARESKEGAARSMREGKGHVKFHGYLSEIVISWYYRMPTIKPKYAGTVTDKVVAAMKNWQATSPYACKPTPKRIFLVSPKRN